jgi:hypothetical protein
MKQFKTLAGIWANRAHANKSKKPMVDFRATMAIFRKFRQENNAMRMKKIADLKNDGIDIHEVRSNFGKDRAGYEKWLERMGVFPYLCGTIETTFEKLISLFMYEFNKGRVLINNQIRFTISFLQGHYNGSQDLEFSRVCKNTIKNHLRKIFRSFASIIEDKQVGTLLLPDRNTNCVVLTFAPDLIQFKEPSHTQILSSKADYTSKTPAPTFESIKAQFGFGLSTKSESYPQETERRNTVTAFSDLKKSFFGDG